MGTLLYYLMTIGESLLSVVGIRGAYEQPRYTVVRHLADGVELRRYEARVAAEVSVPNGDQSQAFGLLFAYITGANHGVRRIAMTVPVAQTGQSIAMTAPVAQSAGSMQFVLPRMVAANPPTPSDPRVRLVRLAEETLAVRRYSGLPTEAARARELALLRSAMADAGIATGGPPVFLSYDPPFAVPFVRRNEVGIKTDKSSFLETGTKKLLN